jgi:hypothetical protein
MVASLAALMKHLTAWLPELEEPPIRPTKPEPMEPAELADPRRSEPDSEDPGRAEPEKVGPERPERGTRTAGEGGAHALRAERGPGERHRASRGVELVA